VPETERVQKAGGARVQVVERAIDILGVLAAGRANLSAIMRGVELPKGTTFRILSSLQYQGLVVKDPVDNTYHLGPGFLRLSQSRTPWFGALAVLSERPMEKLREESRETVAVHVRIGTERVCVAELQSPEPLRYSAEVGRPQPLHVGAAGKILLAELGAEDLEKMVFGLSLTPITKGTIKDRRELVAAVTRARADGYARSLGERVAEAAAISVPIRPQGQFDASLSLLGPAARFSRERQLEALPELLEAAAEIGTAAAV
jgi:IclR family transcriptional regulator, KDG regulon repressor